MIADYHSNFIDVYELNQQTSTVVVKAMKRCFSPEGVPYEVYSDNGPCFDSSEFGAFAKDWDFKHNTSSPLFPHSNGLAENAVKTVKHIFMKCMESGEDPYMGLLIYRSTPLSSDYKPAQLMRGGKNIRANLLFITAQTEDRIKSTVLKKKVSEKKRQQFYHDRKGVKELSELEKGNIVKVKNFNKSLS